MPATYNPGSISDASKFAERSTLSPTGIIPDAGDTDNHARASLKLLYRHLCIPVPSPVRIIIMPAVNGNDEALLISIKRSGNKFASVPLNVPWSSFQLNTFVHAPPSNEYLDRENQGWHSLSNFTVY